MTGCQLIAFQILTKRLSSLTLRPSCLGRGVPKQR